MNMLIYYRNNSELWRAFEEELLIPKKNDDELPKPNDSSKAWFYERAFSFLWLLSNNSSSVHTSLVDLKYTNSSSILEKAYACVN